MLKNTVDITGLYIASLLKRSSLTTENLHRECTSRDCNAYQVDNSTYKTLHTQDCSGSLNCLSAFVDDQQVSSILEDGDEIPVVSLASYSMKDGICTLKVTKSSAYVAISHVWAHGLGNVETNSLPLCQIKRLAKLITQSFRSARRYIDPAIWIDTLCVPVAEHLIKYRKLAIAKMAETYKRADQVLVLDTELQQASSTGSRAELATRILCCGWMRRLWTLQEALLSDSRPNCQKLYIQFLDGPIPFNSLLDSKDILSLHNSETALAALFTRLPQFGNSVQNLSTLTRALEYRRTSRPKDEALCLISILGGDVKRLVDIASADQRMQAFYSLLTELPSEIIFHKGRGLDIDGYRWAPASFLTSSKSQVALGPSYAPSAIHDSQGLHVKFPGFLVSAKKNQVSTSYGLYFKDSEGAPKLRRLSLYLEELDYNVDFLRTMYEQSRRQTRFVRLVLKTDRPAVIMNGLSQGRSGAVLVAILSEDQDTLYCRYLSKAEIWPSSKSESEAEESSSMIAVQHTAVGQRWCIR